MSIWELLEAEVALGLPHLTVPVELMPQICLEASGNCTNS